MGQKESVELKMYKISTFLSIIIKTLFQEGNTISTKLISLAALQYLQIIHVMNNST